ncbi:uncharacterized protein SOCE26_049250 [Sorangium cellulosum]|uniref:Uncharacterized protein n=1 Tax=Sorangium cellulosum TaxID=56 RepID=A0A2L0EW04_SORCE|nr:hypothetical protein [Sorangium cellulosum]AUX43476.1 uncharacterized protein SOCE26_049250 [Sorangium cellulosum]
MVTTVNLKPLVFEKPAWSTAEASPGAEVELSCTGKDLEAGLEVFFEISGDSGHVDVLKGAADGELFKATWKAPNPQGAVEFTFDAVLRQKPSPANGQLTVRRRLTSGPLKVSGYRVAIDPSGVDAAFVPKQEKLSVKLAVDDAGGAAKAGRYEIWGERYPSDKPLYTEDFTPSAGDITWSGWDGKASDGVLAGKYITPEFSPYRVRVIIGPDEGAVKDPRGSGRGKVAVAEASFEVRIQSVRIRTQAGLAGGVQAALDDLLGIEPAQPNGAFAAAGRLPVEGETGRIRVATVRHNTLGDSLNQGRTNTTPLAANPTWSHRVQDAYMDGGPTKFQIDAAIYTRPEIPVEIEARLTSRDASKNSSPDFGLFEKEALGPLRFDVRAEDEYSAALYTGGTPEATYLANAAMCVKRGAHDTPYQSGGTPVITYWQQRFVIAADGDQDLVTTQAYVPGSNELVVYLNRARLTLGASADYTEPDANTITLRAGLTKKDDVVWVLRGPAAAHGAAIARWAVFPPGDNTHAHYGGIRGAATPNAALLDRFSGAPAGTEPIVGKGANAFPYTADIKLDPDGAGDARERVLSYAATSGTQLGLAGILFSPSVVAGDSYRLVADVEPCPYARDPGFVASRAAPAAAGAEKPPITARTGVMTVWRVCTIASSQKLPAPGTNGLAVGVGIADALLAGRAHPGDGASMNVANLNTLADHAFNEWVVPPAVAGNDPHQDVALGTFRATHNGQAGVFGAGHVALASNADVRNEVVRWDHYRVLLPPGIPANRRQAVSNAIAALPAGTTPAAAMAAAQGAIAALAPLDPDPPLNVGVAAIPLSPVGTSAAAYHAWVMRTVRAVTHAQLDALTPQVNPPRVMSVLRWPNMFLDIWNNGAGGMTTAAVTVAGFCRGNGQSYFSTAGGNPDTFEHEMGHSVHLCHFSTGSVGNSCWKHHDHGYHACKMGYYNQAYAVPMPGGATGPNININTGARSLFCAKCLLKMRGWNDEVLPCNWTHPDVF